MSRTHYREELVEEKRRRMAIKIRLRELAQAQGLNLSQVQRRSGLTMTLVRRYWRNETSSVSLEALDVLSNLLHIAPGDLLVKEQTTDGHADERRGS
jgi:transcriptional regulator with XRE-family HTH domain